MAKKPTYEELEQRVRELEKEAIERKRAEEALRESHETLLAVLNSIDADVYASDLKNYQVLFINKHMQESFGKDLVGKHCYRVFRGEKEPCAHCINDRLLDANGEPTGVLVWEDRNPVTKRWYRNRDKAIRWIDGRFVRLQVATDITNLKQAEAEREKLGAQLLQAQKMEAMGTLAGGIAHDFNNLLMGIQGNASLVLSDVDSRSPHWERLKNIEQGVRSGAELTKQLLGFSRGGKYEVKPTDLNELIRRSSEMFGRTKKEITIHRRYEEDIWPAEVDQGQIEQVLLNLYVNAWQAMPGGGDLYLETENVTLKKRHVKPFDLKPGKYVKISMTDTGVGMDEATQQRIFEPFFTTKEMGRGTGLGLASVYGIIKSHDGIITVESKRGEGSTFTIYLPTSEKEVIKDKELPEELLKGEETVLLVDDEDMIIDVGEEVLGALGYKVLVARGGKEAIELYKAKKDKIDMVILDMVMPEMGGGETYDRLKEINRNIKVLLSSGYSIEGQATEILERGCNGFIQKPFNMRQLSQRMREILDRE